MTGPDSVATLNQMLDILNDALRKAGADGKSRGLRQAAMAARMRGDVSSLKSAAKNLLQDKDGDLSSLNVEKIGNDLAEVKQHIREAEAISSRFEAELEDHKNRANEAIRPEVEKAFKDPQAVFDTMETISNSEDMAQTIEGLSNNGSMGTEEKQKFVVKANQIKEGLEAKGINIDEGGQRIFARELLKSAPEGFGELRGGKGLFGDNAERKQALKALDDFDPKRDDLLDIEMDIGLATHKADLSKAHLGRIQENARTLESQHKEMNDLRDLNQLEAAANGLEGQVQANRQKMNGGGQEQSQSNLDFGRDDDGDMSR